ncbi:MAG: hypothetical protein R6U40_11400, partial [Desulfobacterales bacterium]
MLTPPTLGTMSRCNFRLPGVSNAPIFTPIARAMGVRAKESVKAMQNVMSRIFMSNPRVG